MLDLGFEQDVRDIISYCAGPSQRQTAMFSATWPKSIRDLAAEFLRNPVKVGCGGSNSRKVFNRGLGQGWGCANSPIACRWLMAPLLRRKSCQRPFLFSNTTAVERGPPLAKAHRCVVLVVRALMFFLRRAPQCQCPDREPTGEFRPSGAGCVLCDSVPGCRDIAKRPLQCSHRHKRQCSRTAFLTAAQFFGAKGPRLDPPTATATASESFRVRTSVPERN